MEKSTRLGKIGKRPLARVVIVGDIISPDPEPWDSELGIAYRGEDAKPIYYTGRGLETEDEDK